MRRVIISGGRWFLRQTTLTKGSFLRELFGTSNRPRTRSRACAPSEAAPSSQLEVAPSSQFQAGNIGYLDLWGGSRGREATGSPSRTQYCCLHFRRIE